MRVATTDTLLRLVRRADSLNLNRRLNLKAVKRHADPNGLHLIDVLLFDHKGTDPDEPVHHRCSVQTKVTGSPYPTTLYLDITDADYKKLPTVEEVMEEGRD